LALADLEHFFAVNGALHGGAPKKAPKKTNMEINADLKRSQRDRYITIGPPTNGGKTKKFFCG
jgi:hypothetical protein